MNRFWKRFAGFFFTSLCVTNAAFLQKTIAVLLCSVLSFNSIGFYSFVNQGGKADAITPKGNTKKQTAASQSNNAIAGKWQSNWGIVEFNSNLTGQWNQGVGIGQIKDGTYDPKTRKLVFHYYQPWNKMDGTATLTLSEDGGQLSGGWTQQRGSNPIGSGGSGGWTMKRDTDVKTSQCPRFQTMLSEAQDIQKLADKLKKDDKAYNAAVIDIVLRGYNSPYAMYMLDVPPEKIPELFKDNQQVRAVRSQLIEHISTKARNRKNFADTGISESFHTNGDVYSKENIELFCSLDSSKFTKEFWDSLWMAGYIDYNLYTQVENQLIVYGYKNYFETLADIATLPVAEAASLSLYVFKVGFKNFFLRLTELAVGVIEQIKLKILPRLTIKQVSTVLPEGIAMTFKDGEYINRLTKVEETFYRYHGKSNLSGNEYVWFTKKKYTSEQEVRNGLAIAKEWGIELDSISTLKVPKNTWLSEGKAAPQIPLPGGGFKYPGEEYQAVIKNVPKNWVITNTEKAW